MASLRWTSYMPGQIWEARSRDLEPRTSRAIGFASLVRRAHPIVHLAVIEYDGHSCIAATFGISPFEEQEHGSDGVGSEM